MGLYLCVFDSDGEELRGVEVGLYHYFGTFRDTVADTAGKGAFSIPMTTLLNHPDCDGVWSVKDCRQLLLELEEIKRVFQGRPPVQEIVEEKKEVFRFYGITPENLFQCFVDSDCEPLVDRLMDLCRLAIQEKRPIEFQ